MLLGPDAGVAGKRRGQLHDRAGVVRVVIVAGEQRHARRAAQRRGVEAVVLQAALPPASRASASRSARRTRCCGRSRCRRSARSRRWARPPGAFTSKRGGAFASRASSVGDRRRRGGVNRQHGPIHRAGRGRCPGRCRRRRARTPLAAGRQAGRNQSDEEVPYWHAVTCFMSGSVSLAALAGLAECSRHYE